MPHTPLCTVTPCILLHLSQAVPHCSMLGMYPSLFCTTPFPYRGPEDLWERRPHSPPLLCSISDFSCPFFITAEAALLPLLGWTWMVSHPRANLRLLCLAYKALAWSQAHAQK